MKYDINDLAKMLTYKRPADSTTEEKFISTYIDRLFGIKKDGYGNRILKIGDSDVAFSCHTDTVHHTDGFQEVYIDNDGIARTQRKVCGGAEQGTLSSFTKQPLASTQQVLPFIQRPGIEPLGADDATGVWLMLNLAEAGVPGLYLFHRHEEHGGLGSDYIKQSKSILEGIKKMIAFDRRGFDSIITHQRGQRCCSDEFAKELSRQLGWYRIDSTGVFTDSANYMSIVPECTNVSVGYEHEHTANETQDLEYAEQLYQKLRRVNWKSLPIVREAKKTKKENIIQWGGEWEQDVQSYRPASVMSGYEGWRNPDDEYERREIIDIKKLNKKKFREDNDWVCPNCDILMHYTYDHCIYCGAKKPSKVDFQLIEGAWKCRWCSSTNFPENMVCWNCSHKKGTQPKKKEKSGYTWKCKTCGVLNSVALYPTICSQCKQPRKKTVSPKPSNFSDWKCPDCDTMNSMYTNPTYCRQCGAIRNQFMADLYPKYPKDLYPKYPKKTSKKKKKGKMWVCGYCGTKNELDESNCIECGAGRYSGRASVYNLGRERWFK